MCGTIGGCSSDEDEEMTEKTEIDMLPWVGPRFDMEKGIRTTIGCLAIGAGRKHGDCKLLWDRGGIEKYRENYLLMPECPGCLAASTLAMAFRTWRTQLDTQGILFKRIDRKIEMIMEKLGVEK